jgi:hypothetical protein
MAVREQGGTAARLFNTVHDMTDSMATNPVFSSYKPKPYRKIAGEQ